MRMMPSLCASPVSRHLVSTTASIGTVIDWVAGEFSAEMPGQKRKTEIMSVTGWLIRSYHSVRPVGPKEAHHSDLISAIVCPVPHSFPVFNRGGTPNDSVDLWILMRFAHTRSMTVGSVTPPVWSKR